MSNPVAYKILTDRLVIRCWNPSDAILLQEAVQESEKHLKPWMPWAHEEPTSLEDRVALLRSFRGQFDLDQDYIYGIFDSTEATVMGGTGLHTRRGPTIREIGYWIRADQTGKGLATESTSALVKVAFEINQVKRVEIRCDPTNRASIAIAKKLGFTLEGVLRDQAEFLGKHRDTQVWSLLAQEYEDSLANSISIQVFDARGEGLPI